jgi:outer membrane lipoprotein SlyB
MKKAILALALATAPALALSLGAAPAAAQTREDQYRWDQAQRRFDAERAIYQREQARYEDARRRYGGGYNRGPGYGTGPGYGSGGDDRYSWRGGSADWDASRYYHDDARYQERQLSSNDEVYRGSDGRYYCRRSDGTTGLVIGAGVGALVGRGLDGGRDRTGGTIVGGVLGALLGREVERNADVRCR